MVVLLVVGVFLCGMESIVRDHTADRSDSAAAMIELTIRTVDGSDTMDEGHMVCRCTEVFSFLLRRFSRQEYDGYRKSKQGFG